MATGSSRGSLLMVKLGAAWATVAATGGSLTDGEASQTEKA